MGDNLINKDKNMKHIVYLTTNIVNNKIYIGVHKTENPEVFDGYLGCGVKINIPSTYKRSLSPFHFAVEKHGVKNFKRITLRIFDNEEDAYKLESELVTEEFVLRSDTYNVALGGGHPPLTTKIIFQYDLDGNFIKEWNSIIEAEKSLDYKGSCISNAIKFKTPSKNYYWADFKVNKLDLSGYSEPKKYQQIYHYSFNGGFIQMFDTVTLAAKYFNTTTSNVVRAAKGGYKLNGEYVSYELFSNYAPPKKITVKNCNIHQYDTNGEYIKSYDSIQDVAKEFGKTAASGVLASIRLGRLFKNYQWNTEKFDRMKQLTPDKPKSRKVGQYTINGEFIKSFNTVTECKKEFGAGVDKVLKGRTSQTKGFIFKYLD